MTVGDLRSLRHPAAPTTLAESGLSAETMADLVRKTLSGAIELSGTELSRRLGLAFSVIEPTLEYLKAQHDCEIIGGTLMGGASFRYRLTESGNARAQAAFARNQYCGLAPVPIAQYRAYMDDFAATVSDTVTRDEVRHAFADLVISDQMLDELGPAISARHSIFIYGPPGNGKSSIAQTIRRLLLGTMAIPHALDAGGHIIRFFDPALHERDLTEADDASGVRDDRRWVRCRRPMITVGGELTLGDLSLGYNPRSGVYRAPVQTLANGGILVIDDFGRQQCPPRDLLNWWMVPLESRVEYMTLQSGDKIEMPFRALVIFSTNIRPGELVDEAFLRRIQYKIFAENPTRERFITIFARTCEEREIPFERALVETLIDRFYVPRGIELRGCHPRDLVNQALALASYRGHPRQLTAELLDVACASYFIVDGSSADRICA
jgi:hypothetical protein